jgi:hypothetical protein
MEVEVAMEKEMGSEMVVGMDIRDEMGRGNDECKK